MADPLVATYSIVACDLAEVIGAAIALNLLATSALMIHPLRRNPHWLMPACAVLFVSIWVEKGIGLVVPGFVPSPLGEVVEYTPTWVELCVTAGVWALGLFVLTVLVRVALPIELGDARIRATSNDGSELFIGIAPADKAAAYLAATSYAVTDDFQGHVETTRQGGAPSISPGDSRIWVASSEGSGTQSVTWTPKAGEWTVVAMNADGSPNVSISGDVGLEVPALTGVSVGLIAIGAVLLFAAGGIVIAAVAGARRRR